MLSYRNGLLIIAGLLMQSCSHFDPQEIAYYVLRDIGQYQCQQRINDNCQVKSYDAYQRERQQVESKE